MKNKKIWFCLLLVLLGGGLLAAMWLFGTTVCPVCGRKHIFHSFTETIGLPNGEKITYELLCKCYGEPIRLEYTSERKSNDTYKAVLTVSYENLCFKFFSYDKNADAEQPDSEVWNLMSITTYDPSHVFEHGIRVGCTRRKVIWVFRDAIPVSGAEAGTEYWDHGELENICFTYDENNRVKSIEYFRW